MTSREVLLGFVDYENFRMAFRNYSEYITIEDIITAFEALGQELGDLRTIFSTATGRDVLRMLG